MSINQPKAFNTVGPCVPSKHYMLPALPRVPDIQTLVSKEQYLVLHAPRQSGKTTAIKAAAKHLNEEGDHYTLYCSMEALRGVTDRAEAMFSLVDRIIGALRDSKVEPLNKIVSGDLFPKVKSFPDFKSFQLRVWLTELPKKLEKGLVIFLTKPTPLGTRRYCHFCPN